MHIHPLLTNDETEISSCQLTNDKTDQMIYCQMINAKTNSLLTNY